MEALPVNFFMDLKLVSFFLHENNNNNREVVIVKMCFQTLDNKSERFVHIK